MAQLEGISEPLRVHTTSAEPAVVTLSLDLAPSVDVGDAGSVEPAVNDALDMPEASEPGGERVGEHAASDGAASNDAASDGAAGGERAGEHAASGEAAPDADTDAVIELESRVLSAEVTGGAAIDGSQDEAAFGYVARASVLGANAWRAVELGAGDREAAVALARALPGLSLTAVDGFGAPGQTRRKPGKASANVMFTAGDVQDTGLRAHACDLVVSNGVAHRLEDPSRLFVEVARLAREDAAICIRDFCRPDSAAELTALVELHMEETREASRRRFVASLRAALRLSEVEALCAAAGLTGVQVRRCSDLHWEVARARVRGQ